MLLDELPQVMAQQVRRLTISQMLPCDTQQTVSDIGLPKVPGSGILEGQNSIGSKLVQESLSDRALENPLVFNLHPSASQRTSAM